MPLKDDWANGDTYAADDQNAVAAQVNTNTTDIAGKQAADSDLTAIAALSPSNDDVIQRKSGAWTNRTVAQLKTDLALNNVTNNAQYYAGGTDVAVADGGTGASTASGARTNLGLVIGTDVQAYDSDLAAFAAKTAPSGAVVGTSDSQMLTNKTLTNPKIGTIYDSNNNISFDIIANASAANHVYVSNQPAGSYPGLGVDGSDTNIGFDIIPKGNAAVRIYAGTTVTPALEAVGPDTNIALNLKPKGAGRLQANGTNVPTVSSTDTITNKRVTRRVYAYSGPGATPSINTDNYDQVNLTAIAAAITSMTTNLTGTPTDGQHLTLRFKDNGTARAITWGASFRAIGVALPTTTVISKTMYVGCVYNSADSVWDVLATAQEA